MDRPRENVKMNAANHESATASSKAGRVLDRDVRCRAPFTRAPSKAITAKSFV